MTYRPRNLLARCNFDNAVITTQSERGAILEWRTPIETRKMNIFYEAGTLADRRAYIDNGLVMYVDKATIDDKVGGHKARIQVDYYDIQMQELFYRGSLYLSGNLEAYKTFKPGQWYSRLDLMTFWVGAEWKGHPYPFRISLKLAKGPDDELHWIAFGKTLTETIWLEVMPATDILGKWLDIEWGFKAGNPGRFYMGIKAGKKYEPIFNLVVPTHHPDSPELVLLSDWNPMKLYTSDVLIEHINRAGGLIWVSWDNLEIWESWNQ